MLARPWIVLALFVSLPAWANEVIPDAPPNPPETSAQEPGSSKKGLFLAEKQARARAHTAVRRARLPAGVATQAAVMPISLFNVWTLEVLPVDPAEPPKPPVFSQFLRCHYTNQATSVDPRLLNVVLGAAHKFNRQMVEVVSGFRAPKYNLLLRKKGHEVARESQHPMGHAVDFRLPGLSTRLLQRFVRGLHLGGVGYYPRSAFVHADVGPVRYWRGH